MQTTKITIALLVKRASLTQCMNQKYILSYNADLLQHKPYQDISLPNLEKPYQMNILYHTI